MSRRATRARPALRLWESDRFTNSGGVKKKGSFKQRRKRSEEWSEEVRCAAALPHKDKPNKLESKFWGFQVFHDTQQDLNAIHTSIETKLQEGEQELIVAEDKAQSEIERLKMKCDYYKLVSLVNRFGACPGHVFCSSIFPGREYELFLQRMASELVLWWRRNRVYNLGL